MGCSNLPPNPFWKMVTYCNLNEINLYIYLFAMNRNAVYILIFWNFAAYNTFRLYPTIPVSSFVYPHYSLVSWCSPVHFEPFKRELNKNFHSHIIHYIYCQAQNFLIQLVSLWRTGMTPTANSEVLCSSRKWEIKLLFFNQNINIQKRNRMLSIYF